MKIWHNKYTEKGFFKPKKEFFALKNVNLKILKHEDDLFLSDLLLFKSFDAWIEDSAKEAGIEKSDTTSCEDTLLVCPHFPFIDSNIIEEGYKAHSQNNAHVTVICSEDGYNAAAFVKTELLGENFENFSLDENLELFYIGGADCKEVIGDSSLLFPIYTAKDLSLANSAARAAVIDRAIDNGAIIMCTDGIIISPDAKIENGAVILPGSIIKGKSVIKSGATVGPNSLIDNSEIGENAVINASQILDSTVGKGSKIGPFTQLRPNSHIGENVKIGDFVEIKNSTVGDNTSVAHLTYIGDSDVGKKVNFGCGTVTVNYDGKNKHRTEIGDYAFIGCNSNLVAPVKIGNNAYTAAGSTVTHDVPDDSLYICREKDEKIINGWVEKKLGKRRIEE